MDFIWIWVEKQVVLKVELSLCICTVSRSPDKLNTSFKNLFFFSEPPVCQKLGGVEKPTSNPEIQCENYSCLLQEQTQSPVIWYLQPQPVIIHTL